MQVNPVPESTSDEELELNICKALSLTGHEFKPDDLKACHRLKKKRLLSWNSNVENINAESLLTGKTSKINPRIYVSEGSLLSSSYLESMCHENHQLAYKCRQLKNTGKIHSTWIWNNAINVKISKRRNLSKSFTLLAMKNFWHKSFGWFYYQHFILSVLISFLHCVFHCIFSNYSNNLLITFCLLC